MVSSHKGSIILGKLNVDKEAELIEAMHLPVQSIPAVFILSQGQFIAHFTGLKPEAELKQLIEQVLKVHQERTNQTTEGSKGAESPSDPSSEVIVDHEEKQIDRDDNSVVRELYSAANDALTAADVERASALYSSIIEDAADKAVYKTHRGRATAGLIKCLLHQYHEALKTSDTGDAKNVMNSALESAQHLLHTIQSQSQQQAELAAEIKDEPVVQEAIKQLKMTAEAHNILTQTPASETESLRADSMKAFLLQDYPTAIQQALKLLSRDKSTGKQLLLNYMEQLGAHHPLTVDARKRMAQLLFK